MGEHEREVRALEALIASQLLRERDPLNLDDLPELTDSQKAALNSLPPDLVEQLWDEVDSESEDEALTGDACEVEEEELAGMNRAEEMSQETRDALDQARREVLESMKKRREEDGAGR
jgi:hypothetical protein